MASDIRDVVYINYLVPIDRLKSFTSDLLPLQPLGADGRWSMLSVLIYRHGHFGPRVLGPLRKAWPSPVQSNWRVYVRDPSTGLAGVRFVTTVITSRPHALATRMLCEGVPMHVPRAAWVDRSDVGAVSFGIDPGAGSAPSLTGRLNPNPTTELPADWSECFTSWDQMLDWCVPQDRALTDEPWYGRITRQEISLGIPIDSCRRISGEVKSPTLRELVGDAEPVCFFVDRVRFEFDQERHRRAF